MKLYDILSQEKGASVEIRGQAVTFRRITIKDLARMQKLSNSTDENSLVSAQILYEQLTVESQELFGSLENFTEVITTKIFKSLQEAYKQTRTDSEPDIKKK